MTNCILAKDYIPYVDVMAHTSGVRNMLHSCPFSLERFEFSTKGNESLENTLVLKIMNSKGFFSLNVRIPIFYNPFP